MKKFLLSEFSGAEIEAALQSKAINCAVLVFGSCENHGPHLPLGPDLWVPEEIARRIAQTLEGVVVLPGLPFGTSIHYNHYPVAVSLRYQTLIQVAEDMLESLIHHGIDRLLLLNGHDGNIPALEIAARNIKARHPEAVMIYVPAWWDITQKAPGMDFGDWSGFGHGGECETSATLALRPDLVDLSQAIRQMPEDTIALSGLQTPIWDIAEISETGATGDPTRSTMKQGEKILDFVTNHLVELITWLNEHNWSYDRRCR